MQKKLRFAFALKLEISQLFSKNDAISDSFFPL